MAKKPKSSHDESEITIRISRGDLDAVRSYAGLQSVDDGDIMAMAFVVMTEAAKSAREDLKAIMDGVRAINRAKEGWREVARTINEMAAAVGERDDCNVSTNDIHNAKEIVKDKLDSLSEMGEIESLRLQMAMDRLSRMMSTLSNMLNKVSDTASSITQNIK
jgi:hypothetical protein